jgi:RNA polymerase sigma-70 factor (ECF subfamily)
MLETMTDAGRSPGLPNSPGLPDLLLIERARGADPPAVEALTRRYAQRLFRVARSVLGEEDAAEGAVQEACVAAFDELRRREPAGKFGAWLTRVVLERSRARRDAASLASHPSSAPRHPLEPRIDALPEPFRVVFVLRAVEGISGTETAAALALNVTTVRTRLFRAHRRLNAGAPPAALQEVFALDGDRAERIVAAVLARLHERSA